MTLSNFESVHTLYLEMYWYEQSRCVLSCCNIAHDSLEVRPISNLTETWFQNKIIMAVGLVAFGSCCGYVIYMRQKYQNLGYQPIMHDTGEEFYVKKKSKWERWLHSG